jgi:replicative DNA helicase Mcm
MLTCPEIWSEFFEEYYREEINRRLFDLGGPNYRGAPLILHVDVLRDLLMFYEMRLYEELLEHPDTVIDHAVRGLQSVHNIYGVTPREARVRFMDFPEKDKRLVKDVGVSCIDKFVSVVGIVRRVSQVRPFIKRAVYVCPEGDFEIEATVQDNKLKLEISKCPTHRVKLIPDTRSVVRIPFRRVVLQDLPENLEANELPTFLEVWLFDELTGNIRAGDKVIINGIIRSEAEVLEEHGAEERIYLEANSVEFLEKDYRTISITAEDEEKIKALANDPNIYNKIVSSIAPNVLGYEDIKLAIALQLFGGCRNDESGRRGDIHVLIVGDPGVSKSKLLREVARIAPRAVLSTGYSTTGAGLTVSAVKDEEGRWALEAGVLVLADKGIALIDEIEKMGKEDREHMLEALEQQTITVSKAGIHAVLNSRCAVLAAGNPKFGRFDRSSALAEQIAIESNLLSRFDLIFVILDEPSEERDRQITKFLFKRKGGDAPPIPVDLLRKYIAYAKELIREVDIDDEAVKEIENFYVSLRKRAREGVAITARQLEAIRRMTEAFAKIRLSSIASVEDAKRAISLMELSLSTWAVDPETGMFDIAYALTGIGARTRDKIETIKAIVNSLDSGNGAPLDAVLTKSEESGIPKIKAEQIISKLREQGILFFPKAGLVKLVK